MNDASDPTAPPQTAETPPTLDRAISPVAGRFGASRGGKVLTLAALTVGCGVFLAATWRHGKAEPHSAPVEAARQVVGFEPAATPAPTLDRPGSGAPALSQPPAGGEQVPALQPMGSAGQDPAGAPALTPQVIRAAPMLVVSHAGVAASADAAIPAVKLVADAGTELDRLRRGSAIPLARAARLPDRNTLLVAGTVLPCVLQTAMDTATPGYVSCLIPRDVYSDNGAVVLMEKGARVLGEYRSGMKQGQTRLFVLWTRAVTPTGVAVDLASPASDALGRAGFDGDLDTFFWKRFGGALMLSIVGNAATAAAAHGNSGTINVVPPDTAGIALQNSINIPPVLRKPQGAEVTIFVAQDIDFSGVYALQARRP